MLIICDQNVRLRASAGRDANPMWFLQANVFRNRT